MKTWFLFSLLFLILSLADRVAAYPNFIGYGYSTCITCHYNNHGSGALNDYGRALFAQEIAARPFISAKVTDEQLADRSGFIPGVELPWWIRPGIKYRGLWFERNTTTSNAVSNFVQMQREIDLALHFDQSQRFVAVFSLNYLPKPADLYGKGQLQDSFYREQYLRVKATKNLFVLAGLFDQVYGVRVIDHTAYSRGGLGLDQYSQTHGLTMQWAESKWEVAAQYHAGNLNAKPENQQKGWSFTGEYEISDKHRFGSSLLMTDTDTKSYRRFALHDRWGLSRSPGSSFLWEAGIFQNLTKPAVAGTPPTGMYALAELLISITRGYNILSTIERSQGEIKGTSPEKQRWSLGGLLFPFQRTELRLSLVNDKSLTADSASADTWSTMGQLHVSF